MKVIVIVWESSAQAQNQINALAAKAGLPGAEKELVFLRSSGDSVTTPEAGGYDRLRIVLPQGNLPEEAEAYAQAAAEVLAGEEALIVLPATTEGNQAAALLAGLLGCGCVLQVQEMALQEGRPVLRRAAYSNHLTAEFVPQSLPVVCSAVVLPGTEVPVGETPEAETVTLSAVIEAPSWAEEIEEIPASEEEGITAAKRVVVAGRGVGSRENIPQMRALAEKMDASLAATRPVVYDGWVEKSAMVGASAAIIAPEFCLVMGASGAAAFAAGVEKSKYLVAVNQDPSAAIFRIADLGIVEDCVALAEELCKEAPGEEKS